MAVRQDFSVHCNDGGSENIPGMFKTEFVCLTQFDSVCWKCSDCLYPLHVTDNIVVISVVPFWGPFKAAYLMTIRQMTGKNTQLDMDSATTSTSRQDSSSDDDQIRPMDIALEASKHLKLGLSKMESAACIYHTEYAPYDPYDNRVHPFQQQFQNTYEGT